MSDAETRRSLNAYLSCEFGLNDEDGDTHATESFPFYLRLTHTFVLGARHVQIFEFDHDADTYFAIAGRALNFYPRAGMSATDLEVQMRGAAWIAEQEPIDGNTSLIGEAVPSALTRRARMREIASDVTGFDDPSILDGIYLRKRGNYLVLVDRPGASTLLLSDGHDPVEVPFPAASPARRMSYAIGRRQQTEERAS
jgi:hypothetical protein